MASSRLVWRISRAILSRNQGWSLDTLSVSRRWQFQLGRSRAIAHAYVSLFFDGWTQHRPGNAVFAIYFVGKGSASELEHSPLVQDLKCHLGAQRAGPGENLAWTLANESRPGHVLAEVDEIARAFGSSDYHRAPTSSPRTPTKRLALVADTIVARGTWRLEGLGLWLTGDDGVKGAISPILHSSRGRSELSSMLVIPTGMAPGVVTAHRLRAEARGYVDNANTEHIPLALMKLQPLALRAALAEARFIEAEILGSRSRARATPGERQRQ